MSGRLDSEDILMQIPCEHAKSLVPSYLDGELTEAQAAPLRAHLLGCPACREIAKDGRALSRWFEPGPDAQVPVGFAARVARRAFAGDPGGTVTPDEPSGEGREAPVLPFLLRMTAAAAALLIVLAGLMQLKAGPTQTDELRADDLDLVWQEIYDAAQGGPVQMRPETRRAPGETSSNPVDRPAVDADADEALPVPQGLPVDGEDAR